jgi:trimethylamine:corrinoid methyltransferase-like protein
MYKTSYEYSRNKGHGIFDVAGWLNPREARIGKEMADAAGKDFRIDLWLISPFLAPHMGLDILYEFRNEPVDMNVTNMPTTGTTAPINMIDAYIQGIAEIFAGLTLIYVINESKSKKGRIRTVVIDSIRAYPFDMKYGLFVYGSAEDVLGTLYQSQINKYFGIPLVAKSLLTTGKLPDSHAAAEKAAHTIVGALCGATMFSNAGLLSVDEVYSAEQVVIDYEIVKFCKRIIDGYSFDEELSAIEVIKEVGYVGSFMTHDTTLFNFKENLWDPELFLHSSLEQWRKAGSKDTVTLAREIAIEKINNESYIINKDVKKELDRIYSYAKKDLCKE